MHIWIDFYLHWQKIDFLIVQAIFLQINGKLKSYKLEQGAFGIFAWAVQICTLSTLIIHKSRCVLNCSVSVCGLGICTNFYCNEHWLFDSRHDNINNNWCWSTTRVVQRTNVTSNKYFLAVITFRPTHNQESIERIFRTSIYKRPIVM